MYFYGTKNELEAPKEGHYLRPLGSVNTSISVLVVLVDVRLKDEGETGRK